MSEESQTEKNFPNWDNYSRAKMWKQWWYKLMIIYNSWFYCTDNCFIFIHSCTSKLGNHPHSLIIEWINDGSLIVQTKLWSKNRIQ
jgi:hypothetical protein